ADEKRRLAEEQSRAADESFRQARQAVDTFLGMSEEELAPRATFSSLRRKFLETALEYYNNFLEQRRDDSAVGDELKTTSLWVKQIVEELAALERLTSFALLSNHFVQQDIKLSDAQRDGLGKLAVPAGGGPGRIGGNIDSLGLNEGVQLTEQVKEISRVIDAVLTPRQIGRLHQITLQLRGPPVFKSPEVVRALELTADQRKKINAILEEESPERRFGGPGRRGMPPRHDDFHGPPPEFGGEHRPAPPDGGPGPSGKKGRPPEFGGPREKKGRGGGGQPDAFHEVDRRGPGGPPRGGKGGEEWFGGPP